MVYLIENPVQNICKIGVSTNPEARLATLQTATPLPLRLRATLPGSFAEEAELHERFAADRLGGEWFSMTDAIMQCFGIDHDFLVGPGFTKFLFRLNGVETKCLLWLGMNASYNTNIIEAARPTKQRMQVELALSIGSIENCLSELCRLGLLVRLNRGVYHLDPDATWRGDLKARAKNVQVFLNYKIEKP